MKKRIIVCAEIPFPRGSAGSNLTLNYCKLFREIGYDVIVIGLNSGNDGDFKDKKGFCLYEDIKYLPIVSSNGKLARIQNKLLSAGHTIKKLNTINVTKEDIVMIYASNGIYIKKIFDFVSKKGAKMFSLAVEWHQPFQYKGGKFNVRYLSSKRGMEKYNPEVKNIIAVSRLLGEFYRGKNCFTTVIPVIIDKREKQNNYVPKTKEKNSKRIFVYAGSPFDKENIVTMLNAIKNLDEQYKNKMMFYWIGQRTDHIKKRLKKNAYLIDELFDRVFIKEWMSYEDLMKFYKNVDYLFFCRESNKVSNAGFPSKVPEAMIQGLITVTNRVGDCPMYLEDGKDCVLFDESTVESCLEGLKRAIDYSDEKIEEMSLNAHNKAEDVFDYLQWKDNIEDFLENLE